jgi:hypothetical protein
MYVIGFLGPCSSKLYLVAMKLPVNRDEAEFVHDITLSTLHLGSRISLQSS